MSIEQMGNDFMRKYGSSTVKKKRHRKRRTGQGWVQEPARHSMSAYGIPSGRKKREYSFSPKTTFRSAPLIKAGLGATVFGLKTIGGAYKKAKEIGAERERKRQEEEAKQKEKEDYFYDGKIQQAKEPLENKIPFMKQLQAKERDIAYREAQAKAMEQKEDQYSKVLEARKRRQEQIEKDYASV